MYLKANTFSLICFWTLFACLPISTFAQNTDIQCKQVDDIVRNEMRSAEKKMMAQYYKKTASELVDVHYHRCEWTIDPNVAQISGIVTTYYTTKSNMSKVVFDLTNNMVVDRVTRQGVVLAFSRSANTVIIDLGTSLAVNSFDSISIQYHGTPTSSGFGSFTKATHEGVPVLWTLSEPYGARDWWPCKNTLDDKVDSIDIFITCPKAYKGISNGLRQSEILSANGLSLTTHWRHRYPIVSYLICLAVTNYQEFNNSVQLGTVNLPMQTFCYPESYDLFKNATQSTLDAMQLFHYTFGDYPFIKEKYGHTQFSWGGGEEHQTNSFVINAGESLSAHELAHQWFGDKITCASWVDIWLNEGFATHLASMFMEGKYPESIYAWRKAEIERITASPTGSVKVNDTLSVGRIFDSRLSYNKGSHLIYMLRFKLGNDAFFKAIRAYQKDPLLVNGFARTTDLKRHLEDASGQSLDSFFRQWYEGQGHPSYHVQWAQIGNSTVKIKMNQTTAHPSVAFFEMPVALKFKNAQQEKTIVVDFKSNGETFIEPIGFIADTVIVDPEYWLISSNNKTTKLDEIEPNKRNVVVYPNPFSERFIIQLQNFNTPFVDVLVYNLLGQTVFHQHFNLYQGKEVLSIPTGHWAWGKYIIRVVNEDGLTNTLSVLKN